MEFFTRRNAENINFGIMKAILGLLYLVGVLKSSREMWMIFMPRKVQELYFVRDAGLEIGYLNLFTQYKE